MSKFFITTAIDYVNSVPHIGTSYEKILADVTARWKRLKGDEVWVDDQPLPRTEPPRHSDAR